MSHKRLKARYWHTWKKISGHAKFWFQKTAKKLLNKYKDTILTGRGTASPCELYQLFEGTCCPYRQGFKVHDLLTQHHIPKLLKSLIKWLWKPPNSQQNIYTWICMGEAEFYVRVCIHFLYSFDIVIKSSPSMVQDFTSKRNYFVILLHWEQSHLYQNLSTTSNNIPRDAS